MKLNRLLLVLGLALLLVQQLPLRSSWAFNTGPFSCDDGTVVPKTAVWRSPGFMLLRRSRLWLGMDAGAVADFGYTVMVKRSGVVIFNGNWDHYADPTNLNDQIELADFAPDFVLLLPGDEVVLTYYCVSYEFSTHGHVVVLFWYAGL